MGNSLQGRGLPWPHPTRLPSNRRSQPRACRRTALGSHGNGGPQTEAIYRRYAIVDSGALREAATKIDTADSVMRGGPYRLDS